MPTSIETKLIYPGELARLRAGLTLEMVARRVRKAAGTVRQYEIRGCCYGTARALSATTGGRMEAYLRPAKVAIPYDEYLALKTAASENAAKLNRRGLVPRAEPTKKGKARKHWGAVAAAFPTSGPGSSTK